MACYWYFLVNVYCCYKITTSENLFEIVGTLATLIVTLMGVNVYDKKTNGAPKEDPNNPVI